MWLCNRKCDLQIWGKYEKYNTFCAMYPQEITYVYHPQKNLQSELYVIVLRAQKHLFRRLLPVAYKLYQYLIIQKVIFQAWYLLRFNLLKCREKWLNYFQEQKEQKNQVEAEYIKLIQLHDVLEHGQGILQRDQICNKY